MRIDWNEDASSDEDGVLEKEENRVNGWKKMVIEIVIRNARGLDLKRSALTP